MTSNDPPSYEPKPYDELFATCWLLFGLLYSLVLCGILGGVPMAVSKSAPLAGFVLSVLALPTWCYLGPSPGPGLVQGGMAVGGLTALFFYSLYAFCRAVYWSFAG